MEPFEVVVEGRCVIPYVLLYYMYIYIYIYMEDSLCCVGGSKLTQNLDRPPIIYKTRSVKAWCD